MLSGAYTHHRPIGCPQHPVCCRFLAFPGIFYTMPQRKARDPMPVCRGNLPAPGIGMGKGGAALWAAEPKKNGTPPACLSFWWRRGESNPHGRGDSRCRKIHLLLAAQGIRGFFLFPRPGGSRLQSKAPGALYLPEHLPEAALRHVRQPVEPAQSFPVTVTYCCFGLLGFSGMVIRMAPDSTNGSRYLRSAYCAEEISRYSITSLRVLGS